MSLLRPACLCALLSLAFGGDDSSRCKNDAKGECASVLLQKSARISQTVEKQEEEKITQHVSFEESQANERSRVKLLVESDLDKLASRHYRAYRADESCTDNANKAFNHFVASTKLAEELTPQELAAYRQRFVDEVNYMCKHDPQTFEHWIALIRAALAHEAPVMTAAVAASINNAHLAFQVAMQGWMVHESALTYAERMGKVVTAERNATMALATEKYYTGKVLQSNQPPESFESSAAWPLCSGIFEKPLNQGTCGSCWAFGALLAADSRLCVATDGIFSGPRAQLSRGFVTSCANNRQDGCQGDLPSSAYDLLGSTGVPTGGPSGCKPYWGTGQGQDHFQSGSSAPPCPRQCEHPYSGSLASDLFVVPGLGNYREIWPTNAQGNIDAKLSMMEHGPLSFGIFADNTFMGYSGGIHDRRCRKRPNHEVVATGWGPGYFVGMNSWGPNWGINGGFKVADCKVTDWTIPGAIARDIASRLPSLDSPAPAPSTTPAPAPAWSVTGDCELDGTGCVTSKNFPLPYGSDEDCTIGKNFGKIQVMQFSTEDGLDSLRVNGLDYNGHHGPHGVVPETDIEWSSDEDTEATGWRICPWVPTPPPATTSAPTPVPPATTPTPRPVPTPPPPGSFKVTGPCVLETETGCVTSPNYPKRYSNNQRCTIGKGFGKIKVEAFRTEKWHDPLRVNGRFYSDRNGPDGVVPTGNIRWWSDHSFTKKGWKICPWETR